MNIGMVDPLIHKDLLPYDIYDPSTQIELLQPLGHVIEILQHAVIRAVERPKMKCAKRE